MTTAERAAVVELLRCAADAIVRGGNPESAMCAAEDALWTDRKTWDAAWSAEGAVRDEVGVGALRGYYGEDRVRHLLEAAQRVEEGSWP